MDITQMVEVEVSQECQPNSEVFVHESRMSDQRDHNITIEEDNMYSENSVYSETSVYSEDSTSSEDSTHLNDMNDRQKRKLSCGICHRYKSNHTCSRIDCKSVHNCQKMYLHFSRYQIRQMKDVSVRLIIVLL